MNRVVWLTTAEQDLAAQFLVAREYGEADRLAPAVARIDRALQRDPGAFGESRGDTRRVGFEAPLSVDFEVFPDDQVVVVTAVRYQRPRARG